MGLKFSNHHKEVIVYLRDKFPEDVYVGMTVPATRTNPMVVVINAGGSKQSEMTATLRLNIMVWENTSWEKSYELSLLVESYMNDILDSGPSGILDITTTVFPTPTGDGDNVEARVHSASYTLFTAASNSL
jgi:hypothetical protein